MKIAAIRTIGKDKERLPPKRFRKKYNRIDYEKKNKPVKRKLSRRKS